MGTKTKTSLNDIRLKFPYLLGLRRYSPQLWSLYLLSCLNSPLNFGVIMD